VEDVLPSVALRQWVLTFPYAWRKRLGYDGPLLSTLTSLFVKTMLSFYKKRTGGKSGAVISVQRTSSDLKLTLRDTRRGTIRIYTQCFSTAATLTTKLTKKMACRAL
jgi:hypothetical protein